MNSEKVQHALAQLMVLPEHLIDQANQLSEDRTGLLAEELKGVLYVGSGLLKALAYHYGSQYPLNIPHDFLASVRKTTQLIYSDRRFASISGERGIWIAAAHALCRAIHYSTLDLHTPEAHHVLQPAQSDQEAKLLREFVANIPNPLDAPRKAPNPNRGQIPHPPAA